MMLLTFPCRSAPLLKECSVFPDMVVQFILPLYIYIYIHLISNILSYRHIIQLFSSWFFAVYLHLKRTCAQHKLMQMAFSVYILKDMHPELDHLNTSFSSPGCIFKLIIQICKNVLKNYPWTSTMSKKPLVKMKNYSGICNFEIIQSITV